MTLTVPMAGETGGRAAQLQFEAPQTGAVLAAFGDTVKQVGDRLETQRLDKEMTELQLGMTHDINQLRLKYEAMGDPEAIDAGWAKDIKTLKDGYLTGTTDAGRPRVDPKLRSKFGMAFDDLGERHAFALGARNLAIRQSQTVAAGIAYADEAAKQVATTDAGTRDEIYRQNDARIDREVGQGLKTPEQGAREKIDFRSRGDANAAFQMLQDDPHGLIDHLDAGELPGLSAEDRLTYKARAANAIAVADDKAAKAAEVARDQLAADTKATLKDGIAIMSKGLPWQGEAMLKDPAVRTLAPDLVNEAVGAQALRDNRKVIDQMTPGELRDLRAEVTAPGFAKPYQTEMVGVIDKRLAETEKAWSVDGVAAGKSADLNVPALPDFDPANPDAFAKGLAERAVWAGWAEKRGYAPKVALMDEGERTRLKPLIGIDADPATRAAAALALVRGAGKDAESVAKAAGASGAFLYSMGLIGEGRSPVLVEAMLRGEAKREKKTVILPTDKDLRLVFDRETGGVFGDDPNANAAMLDAATALYADAATGIDPEEVKSGWTGDGAAGAAFGVAIQQALGGTPDASGDYTVGGIQDVHGHKVALPSGMPRDAAEAAWSALGDKLDIRRRGPNGQIAYDAAGSRVADPSAGLKALQAASLDGGEPDLGKEPSGLYLSGLSLRAYGPDRYVLTYPYNGKTILVEKKGGGTFTFSLTKLAKAVAP